MTQALTRRFSDRTAQLLDFFGLSERGREKVGGYSKGMKQRLALARALVHRPEILFLDEPKLDVGAIGAMLIP